MIRVRVDSQQFELDFARSALGFRQGVRASLAHAAAEALRLARAKAPGRLGKTVASEVRADGFSIGSPSKVALFVEAGTVRHVIEASGKALRFQLQGRTVFARRVQHPGTKPHPFIRPAVEHGERVFRADMRQLLLGL